MTDYRALIEPLARRFFGEPNRQQSTKTVLRFGTNGSKSVDKEKATWFDHEAGEGGGVVDMVRRFAPTNDPGGWIAREYPNGQDRGARGGNAPQGVFVCAYDYRDEAGSVLFQVCRYRDPKDFRQRRPDPSKASGWDWHTRGVRQVPYRLPELRAAITKRELIFIVEGEKDVDRLRREGAAATSNAGGAGKWRGDLSNYFQGAVEVVVIADNDPQAKDENGDLLWHPDGRPKLPGQDHANAVAASLKPHVGRVRLLDLGKHWPDCPSKGDVSDWFAAGKTLEELFAIIGKLPEWQPAPATAATATPIASATGGGGGSGGGSTGGPAPTAPLLPILLSDADLAKLFQKLGVGDGNFSGPRSRWRKWTP